MKTMLKVLAAAATVVFAAQTNAATEIPVTISATIEEACSLGTDGALDFAFGNVAAQSAAPSVSDGVALTCSDGVDYHFSTADGSQANSYTVDIGAATGAAVVTLTVAAQGGAAGPGLPTAPPTCSDPTDPTSCGFPEDDEEGVAISTVRTGTGEEETISFSALLEGVAGSGSAPSDGGELAATETLYIVY